MHPTNSIVQVDGQPARAAGPGVLIRKGPEPIGLYRPHQAPTSTMCPLTGEPQIRWTTLAALAEQARLPDTLVKERIKQMWSIRDLIKPPIWENVRHARLHGLKYGDKTYTIAELAKKHGRTVQVIEARIMRGWSVQEIVERPVAQRNTVARSHAKYLEAGLPVPTSPQLDERGRPHGVFLMDGVVDTVYGHVRRRNLETNTDVVLPDVRGKRRARVRSMRISLQTVLNRLAAGMTIQQAFSKNPRDRIPRSDKGTKRGKYTKTGRLNWFDSRSEVKF